MKKYFLLAVALSALFISCETEDETFKKETTKIEETAVHLGKSNDQIVKYRSCMSDFMYNSLIGFNENIHAFEVHVNNYIDKDDKYETFNFETFTKLHASSDDLLKKLNYSDHFKISLDQIIRNQSFILDKNLLSDKEYSLLVTLNSLHKEGNDGDLNKNRRTIAFAYGAQYNFKQAVLYAGAMELVF